MRLTHEEFIKRMKIFNNDITILGHYEKAITPIECECKICGYRWFARPYNLMGHTGCPNCGGCLKKNTDTFVEEMKTINPNIEVLSEYKTSHSQILVKCKIHDYTYISEPTTLLSGVGCKFCKVDKFKASRLESSYNKIKNSMYDLGLELLTPLSEYKGKSNTKLIYKCPIHGIVEEDSFYNFCTRKYECVKCMKNRLMEERQKQKELRNIPPRVRKMQQEGYVHPLRYSNEMFLKKLSLVNSDVEPLEDYVLSNRKIAVRCLICGHVYEVTPCKLLMGERCPACAASRKESLVASKLKEYCSKNYPDTVCEYKIFRNPKTNYWLPYDIYIPRFNLFCEVNGSQHYEYASDFQNSYEAFLGQKYRDSIKRDYALTHGEYLEIDLRTIKSVKKAIGLLNDKIDCIMQKEGMVVV